MKDDHGTFFVGVNALVLRDKKVLLGLRSKNILGGGTWALPGGHLEPGESLVDGVARELLEETGLEANRFVFSTVVNCTKIGNHYIQFAFVAEGVAGEPVLREPDRCEAWQWFSTDALPDNFSSLRVQLLASAFKGEQYAEG